MKHARGLVKATVTASVLTVLLSGAAIVGLQRGAVPFAPPGEIQASASEADKADFVKHRVFFAHQSVGDNILDGLRGVYQGSASAPRFERITSAADLERLSGTYIIDAYIGENGDPIGKIRSFDRMLRSGVGDTVDIALMKLCYVDFGLRSEPRQVFDAYRSTMQALERDYPHVTFLYATSPLESTGDPRNWKRTQFNSLIRAELSDKRIFDLAAIESSDSAGVPSVRSFLGLTSETMQVSYTTDGGHLNAEGAQRAAQGLLAAARRH